MRVSALIAGVLAALTACDGGGSSQATVFISGVTYRFNTPDPVEGVVVYLAEHPEITATSDADGRYVLEAPDGEAVTPASSFHAYVDMYLQTFTTDGEDIEKANFQLVSSTIFAAFAGMAGIETDPADCQIASTVNTREIRDLTFEEFTRFGAHGVAGATAAIDPAVSEVVYFDEQTYPDPSLTETTDDGGVVWGNVPPGVYTLRATHPTRSFEPAVITCEAGRLINANPPWGLRESD